jgi:hypothetical protein
MPLIVAAISTLVSGQRANTWSIKILMAVLLKAARFSRIRVLVDDMRAIRIRKTSTESGWICLFCHRIGPWEG